jgi:hypothetical protein
VHGQSERAARRLLPALEGAVDDMGRQLAPVLERGARHLERALPEFAESRRY